jgi:hypothetical protein
MHSQDIVKASNELESFLLEVGSPTERLKLLTYQHNLLNAAKRAINNEGIASVNANNLADLMDWATKYVISQNPNNTNLIINPLRGFFADVAYKTTPKTIIASASPSQTIPTTLSFGSPYLIGQFLIDRQWDSFSGSKNLWLNNLLMVLKLPTNEPTGRIVRYFRMNYIENITRIYGGASLYNEATSLIVKRRIIKILDECFNEGLSSKQDVAAILAIAAHESLRFRTLTEGVSGADYEGRVDLMNDVIGDGIKYKGRGFVQLTGKIRYADYVGRAKSREFESAEFTGLHSFSSLDLQSLLEHPELVSDNEDIAAFTLVDYFAKGRATTQSVLDWEYGDGTPRPQRDTFGTLRAENDPRGYNVVFRSPQSISGKSIEKIARLVNLYEPLALQEIVGFYQAYLQEFGG